MRLPKAVSALLLALPLSATYSYFFSRDLATQYNPAEWNLNQTFSMTSAGFTAPDANGGSLIAGPVGNDYEVRTTLTLSTSGGTYVQYLRATSNARSGPAPAGTFYSVELSPTFSGTNCSASLYLFKKESASSPTMVMLGGNSSIPCRSGMSIRSVMRGSLIFGLVRRIHG